VKSDDALLLLLLLMRIMTTKVMDVSVRDALVVQSSRKSLSLNTTLFRAACEPRQACSRHVSGGDEPWPGARTASIEAAVS